MRSVGANNTNVNDDVKTESLALAESPDENRQNISHFVVKLQNFILSYAKSIILKWIYASWKCVVDN